MFLPDLYQTFDFDAKFLSTLSMGQPKSQSEHEKWMK